MTPARPTLAILLCPALLLVACASGDGGAEGKRQREELRASGYKAWYARVDARQREAQAKRAAAEAEDLGPVPDQGALKPPIEGWLKLRQGDLAASDLVWGQTATKAVIELGGAPAAAWTYEVALSPRKGPWELHRFSLKGGKIVAAAKVAEADAEPRLKELLGVSY